MKAQVGETAVPIEIRLSVGGAAQTGQTVTAAIRRLADGFFLDFDDDTFKATGWTTKTTALTENVTEAELAGVYQVAWDSSAIILSPGEYSVEFYWTENAQFVSEVLEFVNTNLAEKAVLNPLTIDTATSELKLWNEDQTVVLRTWPLTTKDAAAIVLEGTGPANRGVAS